MGKKKATRHLKRDGNGEHVQIDTSTRELDGVPAHWKRNEEIENPGGRTENRCATPGCPFSPAKGKARYCEACLDMRMDAHHEDSILTRWERNLIRRRMGLRPGMNLPRCPGKSSRQVKKLANAGDMRHTNSHHICAECACRLTAGHGTDHIGYGYCFFHEKRYGEEKAAAMEIAHRNLMVQKNPGTYRNLDAYARGVMENYEEGREKLELIDDLRVIRGLVQEIIDKGRACDADGEQLTEYVNGELKPISDSTRIRLISHLMPKVVKFVQAEAKLRESDTISLAQFQVWFGRFFSELTELCRQIDTGELKDGTSMLESFKETMRSLGDPRTMKSK